ncbi:hypothetical protein OKA05_12875 [Luteolibacter arcticus]|uniref:Uncharacterized protein n=1 Tax=Luteolibacter arcticus TaxID=1581411 RepID=A0ABT3GIX5_9BACT|nr:hypothetical protein [Luteolibacter arcticus]MCW1923450.1 hypothetical protein [Luteolibacter arcticus]
MVELPSRRLPRSYEHFVVFVAFTAGVSAAIIVSGESRAVVESGWCFVAIAWFPSVVLEFFRRIGMERFLVSAALLSGIAGFDGFLRLVRQSYSGC